MTLTWAQAESIKFLRAGCSSRPFQQQLWEERRMKFKKLIAATAIAP
jgi:hypothetical protein